MSKYQVMIDALETRTMLSDTPNPQLAADTEQYKADSIKLAADTAANNLTLKNDKAAVDAAVKALAAAQAPLTAKLKLDDTTWANVLKADRAAITAAENAARPVLLADQKKILADKGNLDALRADNEKLTADAAYVNTVMEPLRGKLASDLAARTAALAADRDAISALTKNDHTVSEAKSKMEADRKAGEELLKADRAAVNADLLKIKNDTKKPNAK